eukprot:7422503-Pyramimonas_sp.AAC.1
MNSPHIGHRRLLSSVRNSLTLSGHASAKSSADSSGFCIMLHCPVCSKLQLPDGVARYRNAYHVAAVAHWSLLLLYETSSLCTQVLLCSSNTIAIVESRLAP